MTREKNEANCCDICQREMHKCSCPHHGSEEWARGEAYVSTKVIPKGMREATEMELEVLQYLNDLRDSGETNMMGAGQYVSAHFGMDKHEARAYLKTWMTNFNGAGEYEFLKAD